MPEEGARGRQEDKRAREGTEGAEPAEEVAGRLEEKGKRAREGTEGTGPAEGERRWRAGAASLLDRGCYRPRRLGWVSQPETTLPTCSRLAAEQFSGRSWLVCQ